MSFWGFRPYVPVAARRAQAAKEIEKFRKKGRAVSPVVVEGRKIAKSFWGKAWCDNLERYSDYANRLPRGRTYVSNGLLIDLQIERGKVEILQDIEQHEGDEPLAVGWQLDDIEPAIARGIRGHLLAAMIGEIVLR